MAAPVVVQKYGGSSVSTVEKLKRVAELIGHKKREGYDVVVVVSAMGEATDELLAKAKSISHEPDHRELDMLLTVGERISMSLLAMAIREQGFKAVSLTGSQSGILTTASHTNARIMEVRPFRVQDELERDAVVIVAGYQGVSYKREITTLGRGGSDTTAVALAAALNAEACEIYSDVEGVFSADPRIVPEAQCLPEVGYEEMQELATSGARVLNAQAVEFAKAKGIAVYARKTGSAHEGTVVRTNVPAASSGVRGIAHESRVLRIHVDGMSIDELPALMDVFESESASPKQIRYERNHFSCVMSPENVVSESKLTARVTALASGARFDDTMGAVSLVGEGVLRTDHILKCALETNHARQIPVSGIATSSFRITLMVPTEKVVECTQALHAALDLGGPEAA